MHMHTHTHTRTHAHIHIHTVQRCSSREHTNGKCIGAAKVKRIRLLNFKSILCFGRDKQASQRTSTLDCSQAILRGVVKEVDQGSTRLFDHEWVCLVALENLQTCQPEQQRPRTNRPKLRRMMMMMMMIKHPLTHTPHHGAYPSMDTTIGIHGQCQCNQHQHQHQHNKNNSSKLVFFKGSFRTQETNWF